MSEDPQAFWGWFRANADRYRGVEVPEKEQLLDEGDSLEPWGIAAGSGTYPRKDP